MVGEYLPEVPAMLPESLAGRCTGGRGRVELVGTSGAEAAFPLVASLERGLEAEPALPVIGAGEAPETGGSREDVRRAFVAEEAWLWAAGTLGLGMVPSRADEGLLLSLQFLKRRCSVLDPIGSELDRRGTCSEGTGRL